MSIKKRCAFVKRKQTASCFRRSITSRSREMILSLYSALVRNFGVTCPVLGSIREMNIYQKVMKMPKRLQYVSQEERLRE